ncbi:MAG TPA: aldo/keto reductase [Methylocella sp.]|jgi:aryl-alcohol dehydrogenase-like predicted oxidoreductase
MRTVVCPGLGRDVSALGFGCASLGSRVSEAQGLRALGLAFERGVTWYDVAPPYGDGEAEGILGKFLASRRDRVTICTKFGIPRPIVSPAMRLIRPWARVMARAFSQLRGGMAQAWAPGSGDRLRPEQIESSVVESLRRLRTSYIDVLALHEPWPQDCASEAILGELRRMIEKGYVRCLAIAGTPEAAAAGTRASDLYKIAQLPEEPFARTPARERVALAGDSSLFFVTHSVFAAHERLSHLLVGGGGRLGALASQLGYGPPFMASAMLLDYAFAANPEGVVLASMFDQAHIEMNCARAARPPRKDIGPFMQKFVVAENP